MVDKNKWIVLLCAPLAIGISLLISYHFMSFEEEVQASNESSTEINIVTVTSSPTKDNINEEVTASNQTFDGDFLEDVKAGKMLDCDNKIGESRDELLRSRNEPISTGSYEGGDFFEFADCTFFVNPETDKIVGIAKPVSDSDYSMSDIREALGTPIFDGFDEMDGFWTIEYDVDGKTIRFESVEQDGDIDFVWLVQRL